MNRPILFQPLAVKSVEFANRLIVSPMCQYEAIDGKVQDWHLAHHARFALGGVGGAIVEATGVSAAGRITPGCLGLWSDDHIAGLKRITALYRSQNIPVGIQIGHAGRKASADLPWNGAGPLSASKPQTAWQTLAPSALPHADGWPVPQAMDLATIAATKEAFVQAAIRAVKAGFDFIEIHGAHGYLIHSFFSPLANKRDDDYGGSLANRMRFALEITAAIRAVMPDTMPLFYRVSAVDHDPSGVTIEDSIALCTELRQLGVDLIDTSSGGINGPVSVGAKPQQPGYQVEYAAAIKNDAAIPTMAVGMIIDPQQAEDILINGQADLIALGRQLLAEPSFAFRAACELDHEQPETVLPHQYGFYLRRRKDIHMPVKSDADRPATKNLSPA